MAEMERLDFSWVRRFAVSVCPYHPLTKDGMQKQRRRKVALAQKRRIEALQRGGADPEN